MRPSLAHRFRVRELIAVVASALAGCSTPAPPAVPDVADRRFGDEIVVAGTRTRIGTPVVLWSDADGFDAYRSPPPPATTAPATSAAVSAATRPVDRFGARSAGASAGQLRANVDHFVLHYDVAGTSARCFEILQARGLSVHFLLDLDGTIYQTLDLGERAYHATRSNDRSVGIEIANIGAYDLAASPAPLVAWYPRDDAGRTYVAIPAHLGGPASQRTRPDVLRPARDAAIVGTIQGRPQRMYDLTPQQYAALAKLTAALADVFPNLPLDCPRDPDGTPATRALDDATWTAFRGVLGHCHVQANKSDPGPAFQWDALLDAARRERAARRVLVPSPSGRGLG